MIDLSLYKNNVFYVYGLGKTGLATVESLSLAGAKVFAWDDNESNRDSKFENFYVSPTDLNWSKCDYLVLSPGIPLYFPVPHEVVNLAKDNNVKIISDIDLLYASQKNSHFIGITGTNGKSTTTALTHHILNKNHITNQMGGNIGVPVLSLDNSNRGSFVLEVSSFQLDLLDHVKFHIAAILNITKDHIDRHGSMDNYITSKCKVFNNQTISDFAIFGIDNNITADLYKNLKLKSHKIAVSTETFKNGHGVYVGENHIQFNLHNHKGEIDFQAPKNLPGRHNRENIGICFAIAMLHNIAPENIIKSLNSYNQLPHRLEYIGDLGNISYYNDSKSTNAEASIAALTSFENIYWIVGGVAKDGGLDALKPYLSNVKKAYLIGESQENFAKFCEINNLVYKKCNDINSAFTEASLEARKNSVHSNIVLSPACASFDQFKNFEHRGNEFKKIFEKFSI